MSFEYFALSQALTKFVITQGDLEGDIEEKQAQRKALETFRRKQKKRGRQERSARFVYVLFTLWFVH